MFLGLLSSRNRSLKLLFLVGVPTDFPALRTSFVEEFLCMNLCLLNDMGVTKLNLDLVVVVGVFFTIFVFVFTL